MIRNCPLPPPPCARSVRGSAAPPSQGWLRPTACAPQAMTKRAKGLGKPGHRLGQHLTIRSKLHAFVNLPTKQGKNKPDAIRRVKVVRPRLMHAWLKKQEALGDQAQGAQRGETQEQRIERALARFETADNVQGFRARSPAASFAGGPGVRQPPWSYSGLATLFSSFRPSWGAVQVPSLTPVSGEEGSSLPRPLPSPGPRILRGSDCDQSRRSVCKRKVHMPALPRSRTHMQHTHARHVRTRTRPLNPACLS